MKLSATTVAIGSASMCISTAAEADYIAPCSPPDSNIHVVPFPSGMPAYLLKELVEHVGDIASPDDRFDSTDVRITGRNRRVIFVWTRGVRYVVATEHGGIGYNDPILVYEVDPQNRRARLISEKIAFPTTVCETSKGLIAAE